MIYYSSVVLSLVLISTLAYKDKAPTVETSDGHLQGKYMKSRNGRIFSAFLGIPYAAPPIGNLRFVPPMSPQKWVGVKNATEEGNICSQGKYGGQEDCLYVNVFTHYTENNRLLPVLFYIHGGSFYMGSPSLGITGPEYFMDRDIVFVTVRYRLGPFGFLSTEDSIIPGNMGLKDQVKALKWVQTNIEHFGGDPKQVTLYGCSAGASSVHLHMQSTASEHLFIRGISQSGNALSTYSLMGKGIARKSTMKFAQYLNCTIEHLEFLKCLQNKSSAEIENAHRYLQDMRYAMTKSIFRPVVEEQHDDAFITSSPFLAVTQKPWLVGMTANEGILNIPMKYLNYTICKIKTQFTTYGPKALLFEDICSKPQETADLIYDFYFKNASSSTEIIKSIEEVYTDFWNLWPIYQAIHQHQGPLYYYLYDHKGEHSYVEVYDSPKGFGVSHLDDLLSLFNHTQYFSALNDQDTKISRLMVNFWVNFATQGDPTPQAISSNPQSEDLFDFFWTPYSDNTPNYIHIQTNKLSMKEKLYSERLEFWKNIM